MPYHLYKKIDQQFLKASSVVVYLWIEPSAYYQQEDLWVLEDGRFYCADVVLTKGELETALDNGKLAVTPPVGSRVALPRLGYYTVDKAFSPVYDRAGWLQALSRICASLPQPTTTGDQCAAYFKEYLIEATAANLERLHQEFKKLPADGQLLFEFSEKDALYRLMQSGKHLDRAERQYILNDYFEDAWVVIK